MSKREQKRQYVALSSVRTGMDTCPSLSTIGVSVRPSRVRGDSGVKEFPDVDGGFNNLDSVSTASCTTQEEGCEGKRRCGQKARIMGATRRPTRGMLKVLSIACAASKYCFACHASGSGGTRVEGEGWSTGRARLLVRCC